jgi:CheY-like chemotaxis protein
MVHEGDEGLFGLEGRRLLLVEDNRACADAVRHWLEVCGAHVTPAGTVGGALARVRHGTPDLMVVDIQLPDGTGWDLVDHARGGAGRLRGPGRRDHRRVPRRGRRDGARARRPSRRDEADRPPRWRPR